MQFDFMDNEHERRAFMFSIGVIALGVVSIIAYAISGSSIVFYVLAILAIVLGFYMTRHISKTPRAEEATQRPQKKRPRKQ